MGEILHHQGTNATCQALGLIFKRNKLGDYGDSLQREPLAALVNATGLDSWTINVLMKHLVKSQGISEEPIDDNIPYVTPG